MKKVFKFELAVNDHTTVKMPMGAEILTVDTQHTNICVWALVDVNAPYVDHNFVVHGTGHVADDVGGLKFLGSVIMLGGAFVAHVWDAGEA